MRQREREKPTVNGRQAFERHGLSEEFSRSTGTRPPRDIVTDADGRLPRFLTEQMAADYVRLAQPLRMFAGKRVAYDDADNVVHETFRRYADRLAVAGFLPTDNRDAWLYGVARNICRDRYRSAAQTARLASRLAGTQPAARENIDEQIVDRVWLDALADAVRSDLSPGEVDVFDLWIQGWPASAIAVRLDKPVNTVKAYMSRIRSKARREG